jgi:adenosylhomocysteine nucleosidase
MPNIVMICGMPMETHAAPAGWRVVVGGPGFQRARLATERVLTEILPDLVISAGTCGALRANLMLGQVFSANLVISDDSRFAACPLDLSPAVLWSQDRVAVTREEKSNLAACGADIVDMESAAVARVCLERGVPFAAVKSVSDLSGENLPLDFNRYRRADGAFRLSAIAFAGIMKLRGLLRLQAQSRLAVEKLGEALARAV